MRDMRDSRSIAPSNSAAIWASFLRRVVEFCRYTLLGSGLARSGQGRVRQKEHSIELSQRVSHPFRRQSGDLKLPVLMPDSMREIFHRVASHILDARILG